MIIKKIIQITIAGLIPLLLVTSCGNDSTAPSDGVIAITPQDEIKWSVGAAAGCAAYPGGAPEIHRFRITVKDADGNPLGKVDLDFSMTLTQNSGVNEHAWLLIDLDGDKSFDGFDGTVTSVLNSNEVITAAGAGTPYSTTTNEFGWLEIAIIVDIIGCGYRGQLDITSGTVGNVIDFEITAA